MNWTQMGCKISIGSFAVNCGSTIGYNKSAPQTHIKFMKNIAYISSIARQNLFAMTSMTLFSSTFHHDKLNYSDSFFTRVVSVHRLRCTKGEKYPFFECPNKKTLKAWDTKVVIIMLLRIAKSYNLTHEVIRTINFWKFEILSLHCDKYISTWDVRCRSIDEINT